MPLSPRRSPRGQAAPPQRFSEVTVSSAASVNDEGLGQRAGRRPAAHLARRLAHVKLGTRLSSFWRRQGEGPQRGREDARAESKGLVQAANSGAESEGDELNTMSTTMLYARRRANLVSRNARWAPCWRCAPSLLEESGQGRPSSSGLESARICTLPSSFGARTAPANDTEFYSHKVPFQARCALVLAVAGQGKDWHRSWLLGLEDDRAFKANLFRKMDSSRVADGTISREEFEAYCVENAVEIKESPSRFHGMLIHDVRETAFQKFDVDCNGMLSEDEFGLFVSNLDREYFKYRLRAEQVSHRAYWGRGLIKPGAAGEIKDNADTMKFLRMLVYGGTDTEAQQMSSHLPALPDSSSCNNIFIFGRDEDTPLKFGIFSPGWGADFKYYLANNHALLGIFMCDRYHPLDWRERLMMELSTWCWSWLALCFFEHFDNIFHRLDGHSSVFDQLILSLVFATVPGIIWWYMLFFLYAVPCANMDETQRSVAEVQRIRTIRRASEVSAHTLVLMTWILPLLYGMKTLIDEDREVAKKELGAVESVAEVVPIPHIALIVYVILGRLKGYTVTGLGMLLLTFNPIATIGDPQTDFSVLSMRTILCKFVELIGVGKWRLQKLRFKHLCLHGLHQLESV